MFFSNLFPDWIRPRLVRAPLLPRPRAYNVAGETIFRLFLPAVQPLFVLRKDSKNQYYPIL